MKQQQRRGSPPPGDIAAMAERAAAAMHQERFKEAVELFKQIVRQDPNPDWKVGLADAYHGRARALAAKRMFKEAAMVLENTLAPDGRVRDPLLYLTCLIRDGQLQKAASHATRMIGRDTGLTPADQSALEDMTAALLVALPQRLDLAVATPDQAKWLAQAAAARDALAAWSNGAPAADVDQHLGRISLRSAFRPIRLILKSLVTTPPDPERGRQLLAAIPADSPFHVLRTAAEAALLPQGALDAELWQRLTPAQQAFAAQTRGLPGAAVQVLARLAEARRGGAGALFTFLLKQSDLPAAELRKACLNLLPQVPDRLAQFEQRFQPLSELERHRIRALTAEAAGDWWKAERSWRAAAATFTMQAGADEAGLREARLSQAVIFRHLSGLAQEHPEIEGADPASDPVIHYLERSYAADPEHLPAALELIDLYRKEDLSADWHRLADELAQRHPEDGQVLAQAIESAVARHAYKKAAGFARRLLRVDPINSGARRQMIELQMAHARKQMRSGRADLAAKELAAAGEWERADSPSGPLRIARGLVALQTGGPEPGETWLREGVERAGGGVAGWFRAVLEAELMKAAPSTRDLLARELAQARKAPPTRETVLAVTAVLGQPLAVESKRAVSALLSQIRAWLASAAALDWPAAEWQVLAEALGRAGAFDLLRHYVLAAGKRQPGHPDVVFYDIVARTGGRAENLSMADAETLFDMAGAAQRRDDFQTTVRIRRFLGGGPSAGRRRRSRVREEAPDMAEAAEMIAAILGRMPKGAADGVRDLVGDLGREGAVAHMIQQFRSSPESGDMPEPVMRELFEAMVAQALGGFGAPPRGADRGTSRPGAGL